MMGLTDPIFSNVEADINDDLIKRFPKDFDFDSMMKNICEDAGVSVVHENHNVGLADVRPLVNYKLQGFWLNMEKAYNHLVTSLSLYGSKMGTENIISSSSFIEASGILKNVQEKPKRSRPRKLSKQCKKVVKKSADPLANSHASSEDNLNHSVDDARSHSENFEETVKKETAAKSELFGDKKSKDVKDEENNEESYEETLADHVVNGNVTENSENEVIISTKRPSKLRLSEHRRKLLMSAFNLTKAKAVDGESSAVKKRGRGRPRLKDGGQATDFSCSQCSFVTTKKSKLNTHRLQAHETELFSCDLCPKVFPNKRYMLRHRVSHTKPQHCCDICGKMYKIKRAMLEHRKTHDVAYEKPKVCCDQCSKTFCNRYLLDCHIKEVHMGQKKSYLCATCGKSFTTRHSLSEHTNAHAGVKPHVCEICGKSFSYESALRDHRFTHEESKHFWCKYCEKGFSQRSGLKMHMRTHRQNKMFVCNECGRGFTQKQALQRHERVHKGEKPFVCKHCGRLFTDASIIRRHLILVHKINKNAKTWREDIVCTVKPQNDYQVQRITDEDEVKNTERVKNELFVKAIGGTQTRTSNKGPSRAFCRTYPRRVALLDDHGNVIAPPELPHQPLIRKAQEAKKIDRKENECVSIPVQSGQLILAPEASNANLRPNTSVLNQKYVESAQWESVADHLITRDTLSNNGDDNTAFVNDQINQIEHTVLEKSSHHTQDHLQNNFQKLMKYDLPHRVVSLTAGGVVVGMNDANIKQNTGSDPSCTALVTPNTFLQQQQPHQQHIMKQQPHIGESSSSSGTLSFNASSAQAMVGSTVYDNLKQQASSSNNVLTPSSSHIQYFEGRSSGTKNIANWSSMFYYSQLASQFGMNVNTEYTYGNGTATSSSSPLRGIQICRQSSPPLPQSAGPSATTFILQGQPLPELEQIVGMKGGQGTAVLHLESCDEQHRADQGSSELAISMQQGEPTDVQVRHLTSVPDADELILLQQNIQHSHHHSQQQQQENSTTILVHGQRPLRYQQQQQQLQHHDVDLVEQLANTGNISSEQHNILVTALDNVNDHHSPRLQVSSQEDSLVVLKEDMG